MNKLDLLRQQLKRQNLDGFIISTADEFLNEYVAPYAMRLTWLTEFTGSSGVAIVLPKKAAIFSDGRYMLQLEKEVDTSQFSIHHIYETSLSKWISENVNNRSLAKLAYDRQLVSHEDRSTGAYPSVREDMRTAMTPQLSSEVEFFNRSLNIGYDPFLHSINEIRNLEKNIGNNKLVPIAQNPIDMIWENKPSKPSHLIEFFPKSYSGKDSSEKRKEVIQKLDPASDALLITKTDAICWLLNIRGSDVKYNPIALSYAILHKNGVVDLFIDPAKVPEEIIAQLDNLNILPLEMVIQKISSYTKIDENFTLQIDPKITPDVFSRIEDINTNFHDDPINILKACKNSQEIENIREGHIRDGVAMVEFLTWLYELTKDDIDPFLTERSAGARLSEFRAQNDYYKGPSFSNISAIGEHGAIIHYKPTASSDIAFKKNTLYLIDSGAQYLDGCTTDVTRTIAIGEPTDEQRDRFTRVLKGHINLARAIFPKGTTGAHLDILARIYLYQEGLDYDHGTGHGVGAYLCLHEGPQRIGKGAFDVALLPGMVISNEPGYYKKGEYGIRIENLLIVEEKPSGMLGFETVTLVPLDLNLVDINLLTKDEVEWINSYHARVYQTLEGHLSDNARDWLRQKARIIERF